MTPQDIVVKDQGRTLVLIYPNGDSNTLSAEYLRVESPSAEVQGHNATQKKIIAGKRHVAITGAEPVGNYAIRLTFSDGHSTGIYSWQHLGDMARDYPEIWARYINALQERGLSREG